MNESDKIIFTVEIPHDVEEALKNECVERGEFYTRHEVVALAVDEFNRKIKELPDEIDGRMLTLDSGVIVSYDLGSEIKPDREVLRGANKARAQMDKIVKSMELIRGQVDRLVMESARAGGEES